MFNSSVATNTKIDTALDLSKNGYSEAALFLLKKLVTERPDCKSCRFYMAEIAQQVESQRNLNKHNIN